MLGRHDDDRDREDGSTRIGKDDTRATGTSTGADVTSRMAGTHTDQDRDRDGSRELTDDDRTDRDRTDRDRTDVGRHRAATGSDTTAAERYEHRARILPAKTSAAAAFALVFGLSALFTALTAILAPAAVLFGLIGIVLGIIGMKKAKREGVTGKGVALGGLITALLGLLLGGAVLAGAAVYVNDEARLDQLQGWIDDARTEIPSGNDIVEEIPGANS